jgi:hypothetical protein
MPSCSFIIEAEAEERIATGLPAENARAGRPALARQRHAGEGRCA